MMKKNCFELVFGNQTERRNLWGLRLGPLGCRLSNPKVSADELNRIAVVFEELSVVIEQACHFGHFADFGALCDCDANSATKFCV